MIKLFCKLKRLSLFSIILNLLTLFLILLPKDISTFSFIPLRLGAILSVFIIFIIMVLRNKIHLNNNNTRMLSILYIVFILATIPSFIYSYSVVTSLYTLLKFVSYYLLFYIYYKTDFSHEEYRSFLYVFIAGTTIVVLIAFIKYILNIDLLSAGVDKYPGALGRTNSTFFNTIYHGLYINLVFIIIFSLAIYCLKKKMLAKGAFLAILAVISFASLIMTFTRSAMMIFGGIALLAGILLFKEVINKFSCSIIALLIVTLFIIPGSQSLVTTSFNDSVGTVILKINSLAVDLFNKNNQPPDNTTIPAKTNDPLSTDETAPTPTTNDTTPTTDVTEDPSIITRNKYADIAMYIAKDNMFTGIGFGAYKYYLLSSEFSENYPNYTGPKDFPHRGILLMFAEVGIIASLLFFSWVLIIIFKIISNIYGYRKIRLIYIINVLMFCIFIGFFVVNLISENPTYDSQVFPLFLIIIALGLNYTVYHINNNNIKSEIQCNNTASSDEIAKV